MLKKIRWGILGCGGIAGKFTESLRTLEEAELIAVASRTTGKAKAFAEKYQVSQHYDNYPELLVNPGIDVVYVATTHNFHYENVLSCLEHGKHVLCEKVFTINAKQAKHIRTVAQEKNLFVMEAMWTRFLPAIRELKRLLDSGVIGEVMFLEAEFSHKWPMDLENRFYNKDLAGGSLMDQGIYPISFASLVFGKQPKGITTNTCMACTGVDIRSSHLFDYGEGKASMLNNSLAYYRRIHAIIAGTKGSIEIPDFFLASSFTVHIEDKDTVYKIPFESTGKQYEAQEVMDCLREGKLQSDIMSLDESVSIMETMDDVRRQIGLEYPAEMEKCLALSRE